MSGTSMDGINAVAVTFKNDRPRVLKTAHTHYPRDLQATLQSIIAPQWKGSLNTLLTLDHQIGQAFAEAAMNIIEALPKHQFLAIGSHGQTVHHQPQGPAPNTWQLGDPNIIVERTRITTIADWRRRDMAAGGQGAPLTPAFHARVFRQLCDLVVVNLGGIANISVISGNPKLPVIGFDTGPANTLLDNWIQRHQGLAYDGEGKWASSGKPHKPLLQQMLADPFFRQKPPKSTGREYWNMTWLDTLLGQLDANIDPADVQATLLELTALSIARAIREAAPQTEQIMVCGGGVHNAALLTRLQTLAAPRPVSSTASAGIDPDFVEAIAFAWFAQQSLAGRQVELSSITGAMGSRVLGAIYPA